MVRTLELGVFSVIVAGAAGVIIFAARWPSARDLGLAVLVYAAMVVAGLPSWRRAVSTNAGFAARWLPRNRREHLQWAALCVIIGVTEEITWRGVQFALLQRLFGSLPVAVLVCSVMFGVVHLGQGRRWMFTAMGFAIVLHGLVWVSGSLYAAMTVHAAADFTAAVYLARHWPRSSYPFVPAAVPAAEPLPQ